MISAKLFTVHVTTAQVGHFYIANKQVCSVKLNEASRTSSLEDSRCSSNVCPGVCNTSKTYFAQFKNFSILEICAAKLVTYIWERRFVCWDRYDRSQSRHEKMFQKYIWWKHSALSPYLYTSMSLNGSMIATSPSLSMQNRQASLRQLVYSCLMNICRCILFLMNKNKNKKAAVFSAAEKSLIILSHQILNELVNFFYSFIIYCVVNKFSIPLSTHNTRSSQNGQMYRSSDCSSFSSHIYFCYRDLFSFSIRAKIWTDEVYDYSSENKAQPS